MTALTGSLIDGLLAATVQAPSSHNTQPWLFERTDGGIGILADRRRRLPINDPHDRELTISCGAALFTLEVAARHHGLEPDVSLLPDPERPDLLAHVALTDGGTPAADGLFEAITTRASTRKGFDDGTPPDELRERFGEAAEAEGGWVRFVDGPAREPIADLIAEGDRVQFADPAWRHELADWMRPRGSGDGLTVPPVIGAVTRLVVRTFDLGASTAKQDRALLLEAPLVAVMGGDGDDPEAWLRTGRALQHALLVAAADGVHAGYLNQACQVGELRDDLRQVADLPGTPQLVVRLGLLDDPSPKPRRAPEFLPSS
jgi:hypothetical protein